MRLIKNSVKIIICSSIYLVLSFSGLFSQTDDGKIIATVGGEKIYLKEYESTFLKSIGNNTDSAKNTSLQQKKDYLGLIINLKLKIKDANDRGYFDLPDIKDELYNFKKTYLPTFLIDKEVVEPNIRELWEKKKFEVRASHIMVKLNATPSQEDSINAYLKVEEILKRLNNGEDFGLVAREMSEDVSAKFNSGDLYYFTAGMTVPEFENAVYSLNIGEYTMIPVRSIYGLHIIKLTDKKVRYDGIRVSHIMIQDIKDSVTGKIIDSISSYNKINDILEKLKRGEDFGLLAMQYSQDNGSKDKGGDIGFIDRRRIAQVLDSAAFSLKLGEVSGILRSVYGWHILKLTGIREFQPFEIQRSNLKIEFKRNQNFKTVYEEYVDKCLKEYDFNIVPDDFSKFKLKLESLKDFNNLDSVFTTDEKGTIVATYTGGKVSTGDVIKYCIENREFSQSGNLNPVAIKLIQKTAANSILNIIAEKENIENDEAYLDLLENYSFSLIKSKIDDEVLNKNTDITEKDIKSYYNDNKSKFVIKDGDKTKNKSLSEAKDEISLELKTKKFDENEKKYIEDLRQKYPVVIFDDVLENAFKD